MLYFNKNLKYLRKLRTKLTQQMLADDLGLTRSVISSYEDGRAEPSIETLTKVSKYFNISIEHLINTNLSTTNHKEVEAKKELEKYANASNLQVVHVKAYNRPRHIVPLVPEKAAAGYTAGYADSEYLKDLPKYNLPFLNKGVNYRAFEIQGDSMLPIQNGSTVIGEYVEVFDDVRDGDIYIIVSKSEGVVLKKVYDQRKKNGTFLLRSSNMLYKPYEINQEEVIEFWKYVSHIGHTFPEVHDPTDTFAEALERMELEIHNLKNQN